MTTCQYSVVIGSSGRLGTMSSAWTYDDLAQYGEIVWSEDAWTLVTWNGSATFNVWVRVDGGEAFANTDCFTRYGVEDVVGARQACRDWFAADLELEDDPVPAGYAETGMHGLL